MANSPPIPPPTPEDMQRDAAADLKVCEAASPPPWRLDNSHGGMPVPWLADGSARVVQLERTLDSEKNASLTLYANLWCRWEDGEFMSLARTALPAWIRRAEALWLENAVLRGWLRPFAAMGQHFLADGPQRDIPDRVPLNCDFNRLGDGAAWATVGDCRSAAALLARLEGQTP